MNRKNLSVAAQGRASSIASLRKLTSESARVKRPRDPQKIRVRVTNLSAGRFALEKFYKGILFDKDAREALANALSEERRLVCLLSVAEEAQLSARRAPKPDHVEPAVTSVKLSERHSWRKSAERTIENVAGGRYDRANLSNHDLLRLLKALDDREEDIRDLTGAK